MRRILATALILAAAGGAAAQVAAQEAAPGDAAPGIVCGAPYTVRRGDTLQRLAVRVYGPEATYHGLWAANRDRLRLRDPSLLEIGQVIVAPCPAEGDAAAQAEGEARDRPAVAEQAAQSAEAPAAPGPAAPLAGASAPVPTAAAPFAAPAPETPVEPSATPTPATATPAAATPATAAPHAQASLIALNLGGPGLAREIAVAALSLTLGAEGFAVVDAQERAAERASASGGLRFPLVRPDCAAEDAPTAEALRLCRDLAWSAPLLEQALVWRARAQPVAPRPADAPAVVRICRADSAPLAALGAPPAGVRVFHGGDAGACLRAVAEGRADFAVAEAAEADAAARDAAFADMLVEQPALTRLAALRAAAPRDDPAARAMLAALELGLVRLRASGAWFAMVDAALAAEGSAP